MFKKKLLDVNWVQVLSAMINERVICIFIHNTHVCVCVCVCVCQRKDEGHMKYYRAHQQKIFHMQLVPFYVVTLRLSIRLDWYIYRLIKVANLQGGNHLIHTSSNPLDTLYCA